MPCDYETNQVFIQSIEFPLRGSLDKQAHYFREMIIASRDHQNTLINMIYPNLQMNGKPEVEIVNELRKNMLIICDHIETLKFQPNSQFSQKVEFANQELTKYSQDLEEDEKLVFGRIKAYFLTHFSRYYEREKSKLDQENSEKCLEQYIKSFREYCKKESVRDIIQSVICQSRDQSLDSIIVSLVSQLKNEIIQNSLTIQQIKSTEYNNFVKIMRPNKSRKYDLSAQKTEIWREFFYFVQNN